MSSLSVFKAYDIRGIYPQEIDESFALKMGRGIAAYMTSLGHTTLLIGSDVRGANKALVQEYIAGIGEVNNSIHITSLDIDTPPDLLGNTYPHAVASTPIAYRVGQRDFDLGVSFTASHNPAEYVGMKFFDRSVTLIDTDTLKKWYIQASDHPKTSSNITLVQSYIGTKPTALTSFLDTKFATLSKYHTFCVDYSNGAAVSYEQTYLRHLVETGHRIEHLNTAPDGDFTAHHTDTNDINAYQGLIKIVKSSGSEFGIMFDGDADRMGFVNSDGEVVGGDIITAIIAKQLLSSSHKHSDATRVSENIILYDLTSSRIVPETIVAHGGIAVMTRVGRFFINQELNACQGLFAGEVSGHFLFGEIGGYELPLLALYYVIKELEQYNNFGEMIAAYTKYYRGPIANLIVEDKSAAIAKIKQKYQTHITSEIDGVSVDAGGYRFNVRQSNTEPKLRITCETTSRELREQAIVEIKAVIEQ